MRRCKEKPRESKLDLLSSWTLALGVAALPVVYAPVARDPNLAKPVALAVVLIVVLAALVLKTRRGETLSLPVTSLDACVVLLTGLTCASWLYCGFRDVAVAAMGPALTGMVIYLCARACLATEAQRSRVVLGILIGCAAVSLGGILQRAGEVPWGSTRSVGSTWFNRTFLAAYLLMVLPVGVWAVTSRRGGVRFLGAVAVLLGAVALAFTRARIAWVGVLPMCIVALGLLWPVMNGARRRHAVAGVGVLVVLAGACQVAAQWLRPALAPSRAIVSAFSGESMSNSQRIALMTAAIRMGRQRPVLGFGAGTYGIHAPKYVPRSYYRGTLEVASVESPVVIRNAHNEFAETFAELGGVGVVALLAIPASAIWQVRRLSKRKSTSSADMCLAVALAAGVVGFLTANLAGISMRVPGEGAFYYLGLALIGSVYARTGRSDGGSPSRTPAFATQGLLLTGVLTMAVVGWGAVTEMRASAYVVRGESLLTSAVDISGAQAAIDEFRQACVVTPRSAMAQYDLANALAVTGQHQEAVRVYRIVEGLSPDYARIHFNLGTSLYNLRRYTEAEHEMARAYYLDALPDSKMRLDYLRQMLRERKQCHRQ